MSVKARVKLTEVRAKQIPITATTQGPQAGPFTHRVSRNDCSRAILHDVWTGCRKADLSGVGVDAGPLIRQDLGEIKKGYGIWNSECSPESTRASEIVLRTAHPLSFFPLLPIHRGVCSKKRAIKGRRQFSREITPVKDRVQCCHDGDNAITRSACAWRSREYSNTHRDVIAALASPLLAVGQLRFKRSGMTNASSRSGTR